MKHPILTFATLALSSAIAFSAPRIAQTQEPAPGAPGAGAQKAQAVAQVLNLSPQQKSQLAPILDAEAPKIKAITQDPNLSPAEKKAKLKAVHDKTDPLVKSILNPTQYKQWGVIRKSELDKMQ